jgi:predicted component of viral defense system (DUF524 family)
MASPPTSRLRFLDLDGAETGGPLEWRRSFVEVLALPEQLEQVRLLRQGQPLRVFVQPLGSTIRLLAEWPLSGTGHYHLVLELADEPVEERVVTIEPQKISPSAYGRLITDLQTTLPASVAVALQRLGALSGVELRPPGETTLAQELARLRLAVAGDTATPGLAAGMIAISRDPHRVLRKHDEWVERHRLRRLEPVGLIAAVRAPNNFDLELGLPLQVPDVRVEQTVDVFENRLLRGYHDQVRSRLLRLHAALSAEDSLAAVVEVEDLIARLRRARLAAAFLDEVAPLDQVPTRVTMVLLKRPEYRSILESYLRFRRSAYVQLDEPALEAPLENLPLLYELWGTLQVILALAQTAEACGFEITTQQLARHLDGGVYVKVLAGGQPALELYQPGTAVSVTLTPQRSYGASLKGGMRSISFAQIPDITVEIRRPGRAPELLLFDPKYKLQSEEGADAGDGKPKKIDVDTMHAYRDAIRTADETRVVAYAAILYPGPETRFGDGIEALPATPLDASALEQRVREIVVSALSRPVARQPV